MATGIGDLVLVYFENEPCFFARVEDINPDHKPRWYHVRLLVLTVPSQEITWILKEDYVAGSPFTMGGHPMRLEKIAPPGQIQVEKEAPAPKQGKKPGKVVSLLGRKK